MCLIVNVIHKKSCNTKGENCIVQKISSVVLAKLSKSLFLALPVSMIKFLTKKVNSIILLTEQGRSINTISYINSTSFDDWSLGFLYQKVNWSQIFKNPTKDHTPAQKYFVVV